MCVIEEFYNNLQHDKRKCVEMYKTTILLNGISRLSS